MTTESHSANSLANALDAAVFEELRDTLHGRLDVVANIYRKFLENASSYIGALRDLPQDTHAITLHTLKGSAAMVGASRIAALATRVHEALRSPAQASDVSIPEFESELSMFRCVLAAHFDSLGYRTKL